MFVRIYPIGFISLKNLTHTDTYSSNSSSNGLLFPCVESREQRNRLFFNGPPPLSTLVISAHLQPQIGSFYVTSPFLMPGYCCLLLLLELSGMWRQWFAIALVQPQSETNLVLSDLGIGFSLHLFSSSSWQPSSSL